MSYNYTLKYRTFDSLLADVKNDFKKYDLANLIDDQEMIKVTKKINYDLGLKINMTKEIVLEVEKGRVRLPNNFYTLNFMMMCGKYTSKQYFPQGTHIEERIIDPVIPQYQQAPPPVILNECPASEPTCNECPQCQNECCEEPCQTCSHSNISCSLNCKGETYQLVQVLKSETRTFSILQPIRLLDNPMEIECDCPNLYWESPMTAWIKDGWLFTNFQTGTLYLNYQSLLEDDEGNLLVLDHDMINEYYEYALKRRLLENLIMNGETVNQAQIQIIESRHREARVYALSICNTPNFSELKKVWKTNRKAMYHKYYNMFSSAGGIPFNNYRQ